jgi:hypothetical protein
MTAIRQQFSLWKYYGFRVMKSEIRMPKEIRNPKIRSRSSHGGVCRCLGGFPGVPVTAQRAKRSTPASGLGLRFSFGIRCSAFGFAHRLFHRNPFVTVHSTMRIASSGARCLGKRDRHPDAGLATVQGSAFLFEQRGGNSLKLIRKLLTISAGSVTPLPQRHVVGL